MVLGVFSKRIDAEDVIAKLENLGYDPKNLSIIMRDNTEAAKMARSTGTDVAGGAVSGATTGGLLGAIAGLLVGIGAIAIPGVGAILIGGPLVAALGLTGAAATTVSGAATGVLAGGLIGALVGLGVPEEDARYYEESIKEGGILVAVPARAGEEQEVMDIMRDFGANQIRAIKDVSSGSYTKRLEEDRSKSSPAYFSEVKKRDSDFDEEI